jgi:hypothetical protein
LFELDDVFDGSEENDVADVAGVHAGREFLRRGENRRDGFLVVLEISQAMDVLPVPVARVSRRREAPSAMRASTRWTAMSW